MPTMRRLGLLRSSRLNLKPTALVIADTTNARSPENCSAMFASPLATTMSDLGLIRRPQHIWGTPYARIQLVPVHIEKSMLVAESGLPPLRAPLTYHAT